MSSPVRGGRARPGRALKEYILARDGHVCRLCGCKVGQVCNLHDALVGRIDVAHGVPWAVSHDSTPANLRATCHPCNLRERASHEGQDVYDYANLLARVS